MSLNRDPSYVPSVLINKPAPDFALPPVAGLDAAGLRHRLLERPRDFGQRLRQLVHSLPRRAPGADGAQAADSACRSTASTRRMRRTMRGPFSASSAIPMRRSVPTAMAALRSTGVSTACPRPSWSMPRASSSFKIVGPIDAHCGRDRAGAGNPEGQGRALVERPAALSRFPSRTRSITTVNEGEVRCRRCPATSIWA